MRPAFDARRRLAACSPAMSGTRAIERARLEALIERERALFRERTPRSRALAEEAREAQIFGVPMPWMAKWVGGYPLFYAEARGARIVDVDGHEYVDFALGDTGSMPGHSPEATVRAVARRIGELGGVTTMMPTEDSTWVARRAAPALRAAVLAVRAHRDRRQPLRAAHRAPDPAPAQGARLQLVLPRLGRRDRRDHRPGRRDVVPKPGNVGPQVDPAETTVVVEFNDLEGVRRALARGDVACVLTEPALTNIGIVLPEAGLPRGTRGGLPRDRDAARLRRDAHDLGRPGRLRGGLGPDARHRHDRQVARRRRAGRGLRRLAGGARPDRGRRRGRLPRLGRRRRHAGGQRALARRHARHARRGAHRRGVRAT